MIEPEAWNPWLQLVSHVATIVGIPVAIVLFFRQKQRERLEREERAYDELDDSYVEFIKASLAHPELDLFPFEKDPPLTLSVTQRHQEDALLAILISLCERVFLSYKGQTSRLRLQQHKGWEVFMKSYARRANFRRMWTAIGHEFDEQFQKYVADELLGPRHPPATRAL